MKKPQFMKQPVMLKVVYSLIPVVIAGIYFFGWRVAAVTAVALVTALLTEWIMTSRRSAKISYACFVTALIYAMSLPPLTPFWIVAVGAFVAILFGKEVFGGFGRNVFNPAIVGRAFVYVAFPVELTSQFVPVFSGFPGGFARWSMAGSSYAGELTSASGLMPQDVITAATPMLARRDYSYVTGTFDLFTGSIGGAFTADGGQRFLAAGSIGEVSSVVLIIAGAYLLWTKTAQWRLTVSAVAGAVILNLILHYLAGIQQVPPLEFTLFSGGLLFAAVFMVTDPISAPKDKISQVIYGLFIGALIVFFRFKSVFAGGVAFSILFGNMTAPLIDQMMGRIRKKLKQGGV